ncbi:MAG: hypothetical protein ABMB14_04555 [Myxococcota bacterium]
MEIGWHLARPRDALDALAALTAQAEARPWVRYAVAAATIHAGGTAWPPGRALEHHRWTRVYLARIALLGGRHAAAQALIDPIRHPTPLMALADLRAAPGWPPRASRPQTTVASASSVDALSEPPSAGRAR